MVGWDPWGTPGQEAPTLPSSAPAVWCLLALSLSPAAGGPAGHRGHTGAQPRLGPVPEPGQKSRGEGNPQPAPNRKDELAG